MSGLYGPLIGMSTCESQPLRVGFHFLAGTTARYPMHSAKLVKQLPSPLDYPFALAGHVVALLLAQHRELGAHGRQVQAGDLRGTATLAMPCGGLLDSEQSRYLASSLVDYK